MKRYIEHIKLKDYFQLKDADKMDAINVRLKIGEFKKVDHFKTGGHKKATFGFIKLLQFKMGKGLYTWELFVKSLAEECKIDQDEILNTSVYFCKEQIEYLINDIKDVNKLESSNLVGFQDIDSTEAGIEDFNKYGNFIQIDALAKGDPLKYDEIEKQPYMRMFTKLMLDSERAEYNRKLQRIKNRKAKRK